MNHVRTTIEELRRYIAKSNLRSELEEADTLLAMALEDVRKKLAKYQTQKAGQSPSSH